LRFYLLRSSSEHSSTNHLFFCFFFYFYLLIVSLQTANKHGIKKNFLSAEKILDPFSHNLYFILKKSYSPLSILLTAVMEHCMLSMCCSCCSGEHGAWCFKITPVICTSVSEKWDLPIPRLKISALRARQKQKANKPNRNSTPNCHPRGRWEEVVSSVQRRIKKQILLLKQKQNRNSTLWHTISTRLEFQTSFKTRVPCRHTSIYALAVLSKIINAVLETRLCP
jgi:hypothetical protein